MITVRGRELIIPESERQIGTPYDSNSEVRQIRISRLTAGGVDISYLDFRLDLRYGNEKKDTALLDKEISDAEIILTWTVGKNSVKEVGTVWIAVRGSDDFGTVKWATNQGYVYVGQTIDTPSEENLPLTELEELEKRIDQKMEGLDADEKGREEAEKKRVEAENIRVENENQRLNNEAEWQKQGEKAVKAAETATQAATTASQKAEEASSSAAEASGNASTASAAAITATQKAGEASNSASSAEKGATTATQRANAASNSAAKAAESASTASQKAGEASSSAIAAEESASTASTAATTATQKATAAANSARDAAASADKAAQAAGFDGSATTVSVIDTQDLTGVGKGKKSTVQALLDKIAQKLVEKMVTSDTFQTVLGKYLVNNGLTTEAGKFGLDAAFGKNLQDQITQQNSNLGDTGSRLESLSSDLNTVKTNVDPVKSSYIDNADTNILNRINLVVWDPDTASTPYKTGNTVYGNGFCITYSTGDQWLCQLAMAVGDPNLFTRYKRLGTWSGWTTIGTSSSV